MPIEIDHESIRIYGNTFKGLKFFDDDRVEQAEIFLDGANQLNISGDVFLVSGGDLGVLAGELPDDSTTHELLSLRHANTLESTASQGSLIVGGSTLFTYEKLNVGSPSAVLTAADSGSLVDWSVLYSTSPGANANILATDSSGSVAVLRLGIGATPTVDNTVQVADNTWIGFGAAAGRIDFDDQTDDEINILNALLGVGTSEPCQLLSIYENNTSTSPQLLIEQDGTGDAGIRWLLTGGQTWSAGIDASQASRFSIDPSEPLPDSPAFFIETNDDATFGRDLTVTRDLIISGSTTISGCLNVSGIVTVGGSAVNVAASAYVGLGAAKGRIEFDDTTIDEINFLDSFVGINTASPNTFLHIEENTTSTTPQARVGQLGTGDSAIRFEITGQDWSIGIDNSQSDQFSISDANALGTSAPFSIETNGRINSYINNTSTSPQVLIEQDGTGDVALRWLLTAGVQWSAGIDNSITGDPFIISAGDGLADTPLLAIETGGDVGIGTTGPTQVLHLFENSTSTSPQLLIEQAGQGDAALRFLLIGATSWSIGADNSISGNPLVISADDELQTSPLFAIETGGHVGIGITNPTNVLHIYDNVISSSPQILIEQDHVDGDAGIRWLLTGGQTYSMGIDNSVGDSLIIGAGDIVGNTPLFTIDSAGDVGIGITSPAQVLHLYENNTSTSPQLLIEQDSTGDAALRWLLTGGVTWSAGIDNDQSDRFVIDPTDTLPSAPAFYIETDDNATFGANLTVTGKVILDRSTLTIATGAVTATKSFHRLDTEGAAATDDLDTINGGTDGYFLVLRQTDNARDVTIKDSTGNLRLSGAADFVMVSLRDTITLIFDDSTAQWFEISRSTN